MVDLKLVKGDEQFDAFRKLHELTKDIDTEAAAYVLQEFCGQYYLNDETAQMSLSFARKVHDDFNY